MERVGGSLGTTGEGQGAKPKSWLGKVCSWPRGAVLEPGLGDTPVKTLG